MTNHVMIPANNWYAIYQKDEHEYIKVALVCWMSSYSDSVWGMVATDDGNVIKATDYKPDEAEFVRYDLMIDEIETDFLSLDDLN